jgi:hypothetical protein
MKKHAVPVWIAGAASIASLTLGLTLSHGKEARAQADKEAPKGEVASEYPYLPDQYSQPFMPSVAEWQATRLTSLGASTTRLTEEFTRQHLTCFPTPKGLVMTLDLVPQPTWTYFKTGGTFTVPAAKVKPDLLKAVEASMRFTRNFFPEVKDKDVTIRIYIRSESVGTWTDGKLALNEN